MKKLVIFDVDGTLLDTEEDLFICVNEVVSRFGCPSVDKDAIKRANGKEAHAFMRYLVGDEVSKEQIQEIWDEYTKLIAIKGADKTKLFDGLSEVIFELEKRGYVLGVLTNKAADEMPIFMQKILCKLPFAEVLAVGGTKDAKPNPNVILRLLEKYGVEKENTFMVGDGESDVAVAINAGVNCIAVLWGNRTREELASVGATVFANEAEELLDIIG